VDFKSISCQGSDFGVFESFLSQTQFEVPYQDQYQKMQASLRLIYRFLTSLRPSFTSYGFSQVEEGS